VFTEMFNLTAISLYGRPSARRAATFRSRSVRSHVQAGLGLAIAISLLPS
jgi:hypothetical protein